MDGWLDNLIILAILLLIGAALSAAGSALAFVRRSTLRDLANEGNETATKVLRLLEEPRRLIAASQLAVTGVWLLAGAVAASGLARMLAGHLAETPVPLLHDHPVSVALVVVIFVLVIVLVIFGEVIPKSFAAEHADRLAPLAVRPLQWVAFVLDPVLRFVTCVSNVFLKPLGAQARFSSPVPTEDELKLLVEAGEEEGVIEEDERDMIDSVLEFTDTVVRQVMVPRIDMNVIASDRSLDDLLAVIIECGHTRIPVYEDNVDSVVGIVHAKDLLLLARSSQWGQSTLKDVMHPPFFVPENKRVSELLREFRTSNMQMAVVRDEYGGTAGLVTVEDLIEEIVGEIRDEYDREEPLLSMQDGSICHVDARMNIDDLNEHLGCDLPEGEFETVGGFVFGLLGKEPEVGDTVDFNGWKFTVEAKEDRRLRKIKIEPRAPSGDAPAEPG